ncbi:MAG: mandelate racemase [Caldilinea sp. CFX5]|nr:mandelate racemase [Caldilinea sp. CFX5]
MQITQVELAVVEVRSDYDEVIITIRTDSGLVGHSMAWGSKGGRRLAEEIAAVIVPELIGEDPINREYLFHKINQADRWGGHLPITAHGPIDIALWDITAKQAGLPLYKLIGGYRDKILAYATGPRYPTAEEYVEEAKRARSQGFRAYKLHPPGDAELDIECCRKVREAMGPSYMLMSDPVGAYNYEDALRVGRALEKLDFLWYEEPLHDYDIHNYVRLAQALDIPIAGVEWAAGRYHLAAEYIVRGAVDIVRSDVSWKGGITGYLKTAHLCEAFGLNCEIHLAIHALLNVANVHAACAIRNCRFVELTTPINNFGIAPGLTLDADGYIHAPTAPGLGVDLDWATLEPKVKVRL